LGHKRTSRQADGLSALSQKADISWRSIAGGDYVAMEISLAYALDVQTADDVLHNGAASSKSALHLERLRR
jgi:hypothetical protein